MNRILSIILLAIILAGCSKKSTDPVIASLGFESVKERPITNHVDGPITISSEIGNAQIYTKKGKATPNSLHIVGGADKTVQLSLTANQSAAFLGFSAERWTSSEPFKFRVEELAGDKWEEIYSGDRSVSTGHFPANVMLPLKQTSEQRLRFTATTPEGGGVLIDDLIFYNDGDMVIDSVLVADQVFPVLKGKDKSPLLNLQIYAKGLGMPLTVEEVQIGIVGNPQINSIELVYIHRNDGQAKQLTFGDAQKPSESLLFSGKQALKHGRKDFFVTCNVDQMANIESEVVARCLSVTIDGIKYPVKGADKPIAGHLGIALRQHNDDNVHTYRIPGLATTNKGTLIAVYDIRRNSGVDLQEDVDVGMNRSTDGGQTWEPMKVIMDMGEWGGLTEKENGIGDPAVLVDRTNNTIWVVGVWAHGHPGQRNWWASRPGLEPKTTSQFVLVKSEDDGLTWSESINITKQIKDKEWYLLLQGPGKGITLQDGTLVFPAQFKDKDDMPHSTIIYSKDKGKSWSIGTGAKSNTTEAQVIELNDGGLMLNMRDNRNGSDKSETNGRAVAVSYDLGKTWTTHPTSNGALPEPTCMASLIKGDFLVNGEVKSLVLFSNPNSKFGRHHMTIKVSLDDGTTWPAEHQLLIDSGSGRGYSCMTKVDDKHVGILYEGSQADLIYQVFSIDEIMNGNR